MRLRSEQRLSHFPRQISPRLRFVLGPTVGASPGQLNILAGIVFWILLTLVASALPVRLPRGTQQGVAFAPVIAAITLGGPAIGGWVAALGTTEMREIRGRIPWYGTLANHAGIALPAVIAGVVQIWVIKLGNPGGGDLIVGFVATMVASGVFFVINAAMAGNLLACAQVRQSERSSLAISKRQRQSTSRWGLSDG